MVIHGAEMSTHYPMAKEPLELPQFYFCQLWLSLETHVPAREFHLIPKKNLTFLAAPNTIAVINVIIGPLPK